MFKRLSRTYKLFLRECLSMAVTPATYVAVTLFIVIISLGFYLSAQETQSADFEPVAVFINFLCIFFVPIVTMKVFSEERRSGTIELLLTSPVDLIDIIISKFCASYFFFLIMISPCAVFIGLDMWAGDIDSGVVITAVTGLLLVGAVYVSIGVFVSALTKSQIASAMGATGLIFIFWSLWFLGDQSSSFGKVVQYLSIKGHFDSSLARGIFDLADLVYFFSAIVFFVFANWIFLNGSLSVVGRTGDTGSKKIKIINSVLVLAIIESVLFGIAYLDVNGITKAVIKSWYLAGKYVFILHSTIPLLIGLLLFVLLLFINRKKRSNIISRVFQQVNIASTILGIFGVLVVILNINVVASRYVTRFDISEKRINTLDISTRKVLDKLQEPVSIKVFYSPYNDEYDKFPVLEKVKSLLSEYTAYSTNVLVDYYNPEMMPVVCRKIAKEKSLDFSALSKIAIVEYQGRRVILPWDFIAQQDINVIGKKFRKFSGETAFTSSIKRLMDPRQSTIYFTEQHGEFDSYRKDYPARSVTTFVSELRVNGFRVKRLSFVDNTEIPEDCDLLIFAGPSRPFGASEIASLTKYIKDGGNALFLIEPTSLRSPELDIGLEAVIKKFGAELEIDTLYDPRNNRGGASGNIFVKGNPQHQITASVQQVICYIKRGRSIKLKQSSKVMPGWSGAFLLTSSENSFSVSLQGKKNRAGGFACAVALKGKEKGRIVVVGDADIAGNLIFGLARNKAFLVSAAHWLLARNDYQIQIPERQDSNRNLSLTGYQQRMFFWISLIAMPQLALLIGAFIWWRRKQ